MVDYFPGICERLEAAGNRVFVPCVSPTSAVADRARDLKRFIEQNVPTGPLHLVGHSMGGLDARYMITKLGMDSRVRSLTTIGTPHRGTAFADWGIRHFGSVLTPFLGLAGHSPPGLL